MKKIFALIVSIMFLSGCAETFALLGPASSLIGGGNVAQSSLSSAVNYGVKKKTGKSPAQHALAYAEENNPTRKKEKCISFIEKTNSEACAIAKKKVALTKVKIKKKTKFFLDKAAKKKESFKEQFAKAREEGKNSFIFNSKIYSTKFKYKLSEKIIK